MKNWIKKVFSDGWTLGHSAGSNGWKNRDDYLDEDFQKQEYSDQSLAAGPWVKGPPSSKGVYLTKGGINYKVMTVFEENGQTFYSLTLSPEDEIQMWHAKISAPRSIY